MSVNTDIIFRAAEAFKPIDVMGSYRRALQTKEAEDAQQMRRAQLEDMTRKQHEQRVLNKVLQANIYTDPTTGAPSVSRKGVFSQLTDLGMGSQGLGLQHQWAQEDAAMAQAQAQAGKAGQEALIRDAEILDRASRAVSAGETPEARAQIWQTMIPQVKAAGVRIAGQLPDQYPGDSVFSQMKAQLGQFALPAKEGAEAAAKANAPLTELAKLEADFKAKRISPEDYAAQKRKMTTHQPAVQVGLMAPQKGVDAATGEPVFFQPSKAGGKPEIVPGVLPEEKFSKIPSGVITNFNENEGLLSRIGEAKRLVEANKNTAALGARNVLPDMLRQRTDPAGNELRAIIAQIGSLKYKDMSGAAVTVSEDRRMAPYIPKLTDTPEAAMTKLAGLERELQNIQRETALAYQNGYQPIPQFDRYKQEKTQQPQGEKITLTEIREAIKPGGKYAGRTAQEVVDALKKRGIKVGD